jgi:hypothetical protein
VSSDKLYYGKRCSLFKTLTEKSTPDRRLAQVIKVISNMECDMQTITQHIAELEKFYSRQGDKLNSLAIQDRRIRFSRGQLETEKLKASKQEWQDVKECFEAYRGQVCSSFFVFQQTNRNSHCRHIPGSTIASVTLSTPNYQYRQDRLFRRSFTYCVTRKDILSGK